MLAAAALQPAVQSSRPRSRAARAQRRVPTFSPIRERFSEKVPHILALFFHFAHGFVV